jgi:hypothetical protein
MKKTFKKEMQEGLKRTSSIVQEIITEKDLEHLPLAVKKYLQYVGVVGKPKVNNLHLKFKGRIRSSEEGGWMKLEAEQYSFFDDVTRAFYIKASKVGVPALGLHLYKKEKAIMIIKLLGLFTVVDAKGVEMDRGETVTVFNDMCFMAPSTLISRNIEWEESGELSVKAKYTNGGITISAELFFNEKGELIDFISYDRYETADGKTYNNYPWLTPANVYKDFNGYRLTSGASTIYRRPDKDFCYGEFNLVEIEYNCSGSSSSN